MSLQQFCAAQCALKIYNDARVYHATLAMMLLGYCRTINLRVSSKLGLHVSLYPSSHIHNHSQEKAEAKGDGYEEELDGDRACLEHVVAAYLRQDHLS